MSVGISAAFGISRPLGNREAVDSLKGAATFNSELSRRLLYGCLHRCISFLVEMFALHRLFGASDRRFRRRLVDLMLGNCHIRQHGNRFLSYFDKARAYSQSRLL